MSREPSSAANRLRSAGLPAVVPDAPEPPKPEPRKVMRVRVEPVTPKQEPQPGRREMEALKRRPTRKTVYEPMTEQERTWLRGYRAPRRVSEMTAEQMNDYRLYPGGDS